MSHARASCVDFADVLKANLVQSVNASAPVTMQRGARFFVKVSICENFYVVRGRKYVNRTVFEFHRKISCKFRVGAQLFQLSFFPGTRFFVSLFVECIIRPCERHHVVSCLRFDFWSTDKLAGRHLSRVSQARGQLCQNLERESMWLFGCASYTVALRCPFVLDTSFWAELLCQTQ